MKKNEKKLNDLKNDVEVMSDDELNEVAGGYYLKLKKELCKEGFQLDESGKCVKSEIT